MRYIAGYIVRELKEPTSVKSCQTCYESIVGEPGSSILIDIKNRGFLFHPSQELHNLCLTLESLLRMHADFIYRSTFERDIINLVNNEKYVFFISEHFENRRDHYEELVLFVSKMYLTVRIRHEEERRSQVEKYVRHLYTKMILWSHQ